MRYHPFFALLGLGALLPSLLAALALPGAGTPAAPAGAFASGLFERVWTRSDRPVAAGVAARSWTWGPGSGPTLQEPFAGGMRTVQYFDKARMEVNTQVR